MNGSPSHSVLVVSGPALRPSLSEALEHDDAFKRHIIHASFSDALECLKAQTPQVVLVGGSMLALELIQALEHEHIRVPTVAVYRRETSDPIRHALMRVATEVLAEEQLDPDRLARTLRLAYLQHHTQELEASLRHSDRLDAVGQLAASVAHEINNPMMWLVSSADQHHMALDTLALAFDKMDPFAFRDALHDARQIVGESNEGIRRIARITKALQNYARLTPDPTFDNVDLNTVVDIAVKLAGINVRHHARLDVVPSPAPASVFADANLLSQVIVNLVVNALHALQSTNHSTQDKIIRLTTSIEGPHVVLRVEDSGPGVPPHLREQIFRPFFSTKAAGEGTGMGLAITNDILVQHQGSLDLDDSPELGGARFTIHLPRIAIEHAFAARRRSSTSQLLSSPGLLRALRVLVIDDEPFVRKAITSGLKECEVVAVGTCAAALAELSTGEDVDLIICDVTLNDGGARDVIQWLEAHRPALLRRLALCSGGAVDASTERLIQSFPGLMIPKPVSAGRLRGLVSQWVQSQGAMP